MTRFFDNTLAMEREFIPVRIAVLTVSDTRTIETDTSGRYIADAMATAGHTIAAHVIVKDSELLIRAQLAQWIADPGVDVVLAPGGTGVTPRDVTPEALAPLVTSTSPASASCCASCRMRRSGPRRSRAAPMRR